MRCPIWLLTDSSPVESPFAAVRLRTAAAQRYRRVEGATALIWRVLMVAQHRFRALDGFDLLPAVYAGRPCRDGKLTKQQSIAPKKKAA